MNSPFPLLKRIRLRFSGAILAVLMVLGGLVFVGVWIGTAPPDPPQLGLVALQQTGRFSDTIGVAPVEQDGSLRFPLVLAVRNVGIRAATPTAVLLSIPVRFRLRNDAGEPMPFDHTPGAPLARYRVQFEPRPVQPGAQPVVLPGVDTLWIEPWLPDYYCVLNALGVPDFVPAPEYPPALVADVMVYYAFETQRRDPAQTGLLRLQLDSTALRGAPGPTPALFPTEMIRPNTAPPTVELAEIGSRTELCGDPDQALSLRSVLWETPSGGRMIIVENAGVPRKRLYDLDRDSIIELVTWDGDADGFFEAQSRARFPIPSWTLPPPPPPPPTPVDTVGVVADSVGVVPDTSRAPGTGGRGGAADTSAARGLLR
jgi:hypothetical protein